MVAEPVRSSGLQRQSVPGVYMVSAAPLLSTLKALSIFPSMGWTCNPHQALIWRTFRRGRLYTTPIIQNQTCRIVQVGDGLQDDAGGGPATRKPEPPRPSPGVRSRVSCQSTAFRATLSRASSRGKIPLSISNFSFSPSLAVLVTSG